MTQQTPDDERTRGDEREQNPAEIEAQIEQTRQVISQDLRAIGEKLSPEHLKEQAKEAMEGAKDAAAEKLQEVKAAAREKLLEAKDAAVSSISETVDEVREGTRQASEASLRFVRKNAVPLAMIGIGVAWLVRSNRNGSRDSWRAPRGPRRAFGSNGEGGAGLRYGESDLARNNPLAVGAAALIAGVGVGLLLPRTEPENELLGAQRDRLLPGAKSSVEELEHSAKEAVRGVGESLSEVGRAQA